MKGRWFGALNQRYADHVTELGLLSVADLQRLAGRAAHARGSGLGDVLGVDRGFAAVADVADSFRHPVMPLNPAEHRPFSSTDVVVAVAIQIESSVMRMPSVYE